METKFAIGIDIGGTSIKSAVVSREGKILYFFDKKTPDNFDAFSLYLDRIINLYKNRQNISGIGIGIPGMIDFKSKNLVFLPHIKYLINKRIINQIENKYKLTCLMDNDAHCALSGLLFFKYKRTDKTIILLTFGTGTGSAIAISGKLYSGNKFSVAGLGEMIIDTNGRLCTCGRRGCLNAYTGAIGIKRIILNNLNQNISTKQLIGLIKTKDIRIKPIVEEISYHLGIGLANIENIFKPDEIIFTGKNSVLWKHLKKMALATFLDNQFGNKKHISTQIKISPFGVKTGVLGAASLVLSH